jgi:hypothetical protein
MATFTQIKSIRLILNDPANFIDLVSVANTAALPGTPAPQTAYFVADISTYKMHNGTAYVSINDLQVSDGRISEWFDAYGERGAVMRGYAAIIQRLGQQLQMVKNSDGAESTEYTSIDKMLAYYRQVSADYDKIVASETNKDTGRWGKLAAPEIAGGYV